MEAKSLDFWQEGHPYRKGGGILALSPKEFAPPTSQQLQLSPRVSTRSETREAEALLRPRAAFRMRLGASGEIQALGSPCFWQLDVFLVSSMSFLTFPCPLLACARVPSLPSLPCPPPHFRAVHSECSCSLSLCLDVLLCVTQWVSLFLVCFFFLDSCRLFIVVPKACRCGVKYIVQIPVSSASLMLELSPLTLC